MKFPVVIIKKGESPIYFLTKGNFGLISRGGERFYKHGIIYDSEGNVFSITAIESIQKAPLLKSIKYVQPMYQVQVHCEKLNSISLEEFKELITGHIGSHRKYWLSKDSFEDLRNSIKEKNDFYEIIIFLK